MRSLTLTLLSILVGCSATPPAVRKEAPVSELSKKIARFAPTPIGVEPAVLAALTPGDREALAKMVEAAKLLNPLFLRQVWHGNAALEAKLAADTGAEGQDRYRFFRINKGPWSRLDHNEPFVDGVPAKPAGAGFYPEDLTKEEFEKWQTLHKAAAQSFFTVIERDEKKELKAVPYSQTYREFLEPAAKLLREAAALTTNPTLKKFLTLRAEAFGKDDYYASDVA